MPITRNDIEHCTALLRRNGATRVVLFGSAIESLDAARDLDLACAGIPFWTLLGLMATLRKSLGLSVDLIPLDDGSPMTAHVERWGRLLYDSTETPR